MPRQLIISLSLSLLLSGCDFLDIKGVAITYNDVDERFDSSMAWNKEHTSHNITSSDADYTFFIISDSHLGGTKNITQMYNEATAEAADGILMIGDLCSGNKKDYDNLKAVVDRYSHLPSLQIVGNHDLYFKGWNYFYNYFGSSTYSFSVTTPKASDLFMILEEAL
jgi:hypothetical protein